MNLIIGDLWSELGKADLLLYPANNVFDKDGRHVMGAGVAQQFKKRFPLLPCAMGHRLKNCTDFYGVVSTPWMHEDFAFRLGAFQSKYHWRDPSPLELIERSAWKLALGANQFGRVAMD